jgi:hypothetical protein
MEIIIIDRKTFDAMMAQVDKLVHRVGELSGGADAGRLRDRLDNQDVCRLLHISPRTLQTLRSNGSLPYIQINRKIWYNPEDVEKLVGKVADPIKR